jgi:hypothetical protein
MKKLFFLLFTTSIIISSCNNNENDLTEKLVGTYVGEIHILPSTNVSNYTVVVTRVNDNRVKITPQDSQASTWEMDIIENSGTSYTCDGCSVTQLTFDLSHNPHTIAYNYNSNAEQFSGEKQ